MYGLFGLLLTSGENIMSIASLEIYLLRQMVVFNTYFIKMIKHLSEISLVVIFIHVGIFNNYYTNIVCFVFFKSS